MSKCIITRRGSSSSDSALILKFKNENILLNKTFSSSFFTITKTDNKIIVSVPAGSGAAWYTLVGNLNLKINTFYKLTVSTFGYGRLGLSNQNGNPHNGSGSSSTVTTNTNACVISTMTAKDDEVVGDNYVVANGATTAIFVPNLSNGSDTATTQTMSIWYCNDLELDGKREAFTFEITLQEQDTIGFGD